MSTTDGWTLDRRCLREALARWNKTNPDAPTRAKVNELLMDLVKDPLHRGEEDRDHPGIWFARIGGTDIGVTYVPDIDQQSVCVVFVD